MNIPNNVTLQSPNQSLAMSVQIIIDNILQTITFKIIKKKDPLEKHTNPQEVTLYIYDYNTNINIRLKFCTILLINVFFPYDVKVIIDIW